MGVLGVALIARAVSFGQVWPLSVQMLAGVALVVYAAFRLWTLM
jgi:hypothetical protein